MVTTDFQRLQSFHLSDHSLADMTVTDRLFDGVTSFVIQIMVPNLHDKAEFLSNNIEMSMKCCWSFKVNWLLPYHRLCACHLGLVNFGVKSERPRFLTICNKKDLVFQASSEHPYPKSMSVGRPPRSTKLWSWHYPGYPIY